MSIAIAQLRTALAAPQLNQQKMLELIQRARAAGAETIIFPELSLSGYLADQLGHSAALAADCAAAARQIAASAVGIEVIFGSLEHDGGRNYSRIWLARNGELLVAPALAADNYFGSALLPQASPSAEQTLTLRWDGREHRVLLLLGDWREQLLPRSDAELVIALSPQPLALNDCRAPRPQTELPLIQVGGVGLVSLGKTNYLLSGRSCFYDGQGSLLAAGERFAEGLYIWQETGGEIAAAATGEALLADALVAGAGEFCASIHAARAVIGISGGIDSALAACVYRQALGADNVYLISMPSRFNSTATKSLAQGMAEGLGLNFLTMPIEAGLTLFYDSFAHDAFIAPNGTATAVPLPGSVKENIMARERARILAAAAAGLGAIFTCNGNKAELSVGYATFYGDLAGAFAAQADLWKYQVYAASRRFQELFPEAPLSQIAAIRPSAELSDQQDVTKGLGDPLIYAYHDYLLRSWVEDGRLPGETLAAYADGSLEQQIGCAPGLVKELFADAHAFIADMEYWWRMYRVTGVAKRVQAPPLLALSTKPFGESMPQVQGACYWDGQFLQLKKQLLG